MSGVFARGSRHCLFVSTTHSKHSESSNPWAFECERVEARLERIRENLGCQHCRCVYAPRNIPQPVEDPRAPPHPLCPYLDLSFLSAAFSIIQGILCRIKQGCGSWSRQKVGVTPRGDTLIDSRKASRLARNQDTKPADQSLTHIAQGSRKMPGTRS
jgi:hypothetical protein